MRFGKHVLFAASLWLGLAAAGAAIAPDQRGAPPPPSTPGQPVSINSAPPEAGTSTISGVVIDGSTNAPMAGVVVYLGPPQHGPPGAPSAS